MVWVVHMRGTAHPTMRRSDKAVTDPKELQRIIRSAQVCRLALADHDLPYIVPMHFGMRDNALYFHCAPQGRKLDIIKRNPVVCFELEGDLRIVNTGKPCNWSTRYASVIGYGTASLVSDPEQKREALNIIVAHYAPGALYEFEGKKVDEVAVLKVEVTSMTGKKSGSSKKR
jgi:nitroimidazol reductase NimA-like FMN-containing flavoprotein (pyridoxamine 5'-phosphate oxidase superfamily)